jgi:hypothetical protein
LLEVVHAELEHDRRQALACVGSIEDPTTDLPRHAPHDGAKARAADVAKLRGAP